MAGDCGHAVKHVCCGDRVVQPRGFHVTNGNEISWPVYRLVFFSLPVEW